MLKEKPYKIFLKYVIPYTLGLFSISSASIIDGYFIGNYVGSAGLASINISMPIMAILFAFVYMFAAGNSVVVAKYMGKKNIAYASSIFTKSIISIAILGVIVCSLLYINLENILNLLQVKDELQKYTLKYLSILLFFLPTLMTTIVLDYFVRVDENPNLSFIALLSSAIVNIILDYIFIVKFGWGISGAAYATGISQLTILLILISHFFTQKATLKMIKPKGSWMILLATAKNGISEFVNESSYGITVLIFNYIMLENFGVKGVASYTIISYSLMISSMISFAISDAMQPIVSKNYGALSFKRIKKFLILGFSTILFCEILITALILFMPETLIGIFLKEKDFTTKKITIDFITYVWPAFLFTGLNILITSYLTSIQKPLESAIIAILRSLILPILFIATLPYVFGNIGIFIALTCSEFLTFLFSIYFYRKNSPKYISNLKQSTLL